MSAEDVGPLSRSRRRFVLPPEMHRAAAAALAKLGQFPSDTAGSENTVKALFSPFHFCPLWGRSCAGSQTVCMHAHAHNRAVSGCQEAVSQRTMLLLFDISCENGASQLFPRDGREPPAGRPWEQQHGGGETRQISLLCFMSTQ